MLKTVFLFVLSVCVLAAGVRGDEDERKIGDECNLNEDCENIEYSVCNSYDVCDCEDGYTGSLDNSTCLRLAMKIGDECEIQEQCSTIPTAQCKNNICVVAQAVTNPPMTIKPKEECTEDSQCSSFLVKRVCKNGTCVLALPSVAPTIPAIDVPVVIGKPCANDSECSGEGMTCTEKTCKCKEGFVPSLNLKSCQPKPKLAGGTTSQSGALNVTQLEKSLKDFGRKISALLIGSTCQHDNECKHMSHALCLENVCQCEDNYVTSITSDSCLEKGKEDVVKPVVVGTKLGDPNTGSINSASKLAVAAILFVKVFSV